MRNFLKLGLIAIVLLPNVSLTTTPVVTTTLPTIPSTSTTSTTVKNLKTPPCEIVGDLNNDGKVNIKDVLVSAKYTVHLLKWYPCIDNSKTTDTCNNIADINNDGTLSLTDTLMLFKFAMNNKPIPPCDTPALGVNIEWKHKTANTFRIYKNGNLVITLTFPTGSTRYSYTVTNDLVPSSSNCYNLTAIEGGVESLPSKEKCISRG